VTPGVRFVRNVLSNWGAFAFSAVVSFVLSPLVVHSLGDAAYGVWVLLGAMVGYLGLLDLGVRGAVTRYVARFRSAQDHGSASRLASTALTTFAAAGILAVALSGGLALLVDRAFHIPPALVAQARLVVVLCGLNVAASLVSGVFSGVVVGMERFDLSNGLEIAIGALRAVAIVVALKSRAGLVGLAWVQLAATVLRGLAAAWLARRLYPELTLNLGQGDARLLQMIFAYGLASSVLQLTGSLVLYSDSLVIGAFLPVGMITFFAIAANLTEYARSLVSGISYTVTPMTSALEVTGQDRAVARTVVSAARVGTLVVLPIVVTFMLRGATFIGLWMGPEYAELSGRVLWVLALALWSVAGYQVVTGVMLGIGKHAGLVPGLVIEAACNLALSIVLIRPLGILGSAWGTTIPRVAASLLFAPWYVRRTLGIPMRTMWLAVWLRPTLAMLPFAAATYAVERLWPAPNLAVYFSQVAAVLPAAAIGAWLFCFTSLEREAYAALLPQPLRRAFGLT
jgi:O-antigen/teichoic acid export membrane protein